MILKCNKLLSFLLSFSCFGLLKSNADHELMERNFWKPKEFFVHKITIYKNLSQVFNSYLLVHCHVLELCFSSLHHIPDVKSWICFLRSYILLVIFCFKLAHLLNFRKFWFKVKFWFLPLGFHFCFSYDSEGFYRTYVD